MNLSDFIPSGFTEEEFLILSASLTVVAIFFAIWYSLLVKDPSTKKTAEMAKLRDGLRKDYLTPRHRRSLTPASATFMRRVVDYFKLMKNDQAEKYAFSLSQAGKRTPEDLYRYLFFKLVSPLTGAAIAYLYIYVLKAVELPPLGQAFATISVTLFSAKLPDILLKNTIMKRHELIKKSLPDGLDLMVICTEAGLSLDAAFARVSKEMISAAPELSDELSLTSLELGFLPDRKKALNNLSARVDIQMMRSLVNALIQSEKFGTPLSQSLRVMSAELRHERLMKAEEKAAKLPAIMTVPMIVFILPPLIIVLLGPAVIRVIDNFINR
ncbi:type II secretion system F family protein [Kiloniella sp. EL199]|uniref:type II secretion system F family protein n=1 Tax=Kiloniella sp. EL199 TaxID=2107581 RepID=UPI000EA37A87|nr:type II secretion system F family protein [Kiloniella sp. EL199]